jgi:hypothetical protein
MFVVLKVVSIWKDFYRVSNLKRVCVCCYTLGKGRNEVKIGK